MLVVEADNKGKALFIQYLLYIFKGCVTVHKCAKYACVIFLTLLLSAMCVNAESSLHVNLNYNSETRVISITGHAGYGREMLNFVILPVNLDKADVDTDFIEQNNNVVFKTVATGNDGSVSANIALNDKFLNGRYNVFIEGTNISSVKMILVYSKPEMQAFISRVNAAASVDALKSLISREGKSLGFDDGSFEANQSVISSIVFQRRPSTGYEVEEFLKQYFIAEGVSKYINDKITFEAMTSGYSAYLGSYTEKYNLLKANEKASMNELMKKGNYLSQSFTDIFEEAYILSKVKNCNSVAARL